MVGKLTAKLQYLIHRAIERFGIIEINRHTDLLAAEILDWKDRREIVIDALMNRLRLPFDQ